MEKVLRELSNCVLRLTAVVLKFSQYTVKLMNVECGT